MRESGSFLRNSSGVFAGDFPASVALGNGSSFWMKTQSGISTEQTNRTLSLQSGDANVYYDFYNIASNLVYYWTSLQLKRVDSATYKWRLRVYGSDFYDEWGPQTNTRMIDWVGEKSGLSPTGTYDQVSVSYWTGYGTVGYPSSATLS
jgi:hypothetical protein